MNGPAEFVWCGVCGLAVEYSVLNAHKRECEAAEAEAGEVLEQMRARRVEHGFDIETSTPAPPTMWWRHPLPKVRGGWALGYVEWSPPTRRFGWSKSGGKTRRRGLGRVPSSLRSRKGTSTCRCAVTADSERLVSTVEGRAPGQHPSMIGSSLNTGTSEGDRG